MPTICPSSVRALAGWRPAFAVARAIALTQFHYTADGTYVQENGRVITPILPQHLSTVNACCEVRAGVYILPTISYVLLPFPR